MSIDNLLSGSKKNKGSAKPKQQAATIEEAPLKVYRRLYIFQESVELLDDITYSKEQQGDYSYTQGDAIREGLELLAKKINAKKAPQGYKKK